MKTIHFNDTLIAFEPISRGSRTDRHTREQEAIQNIINQLFHCDITISHKPSGAPYIAERPDLHISVSHSSTQAVLAISHHGPIGVDTETLRPQLERVIDRYLSPYEQNEWPTPQDHLTAWCIKEAAYKAADIPGIDLAQDISIHRPDSVAVKDHTFTYKTIEQSEHEVTVLVTPRL